MRQDAAAEDRRLSPGATKQDKKEAMLSAMAMARHQRLPTHRNLPTKRGAFRPRSGSVTSAFKARDIQNKEPPTEQQIKTMARLRGSDYGPVRVVECRQTIELRDAAETAVYAPQHCFPHAASSLVPSSPILNDQPRSPAALSPDLLANLAARRRCSTTSAVPQGAGGKPSSERRRTTWRRTRMCKEAFQGNCLVRVRISIRSPTSCREACGSCYRGVGPQPGTSGSHAMIWPTVCGKGGTPRYGLPPQKSYIIPGQKCAMRMRHQVFPPTIPPSLQLSAPAPFRPRASRRLPLSPCACCLSSASAS